MAVDSSARGPSTKKVESTAAPTFKNVSISSLQSSTKFLEHPVATLLRRKEYQTIYAWFEATEETPGTQDDFLHRVVGGLLSDSHPMDTISNPLELLKKLLRIESKSLGWSSQDRNGNSLLHLVASNIQHPKSFETLGFLITKARINQTMKNDKGDLFLHLMMERILDGHLGDMSLEFLKQLFTIDGLRWDMKDNQDQTVLHIVAKRGEDGYEILRELIDAEKCGDVNTLDSNGHSVLHHLLFKVNCNTRSRITSYTYRFDQNWPLRYFNERLDMLNWHRTVDGDRNILHLAAKQRDRTRSITAFRSLLTNVPCTPQLAKQVDEKGYPPLYLLFKYLSKSKESFCYVELKALLQVPSLDLGIKTISNSRSLLHRTQKKSNSSGWKNQQRLFTALLETERPDISRILDDKDKDGLSVLHCAIRLNNESDVRRLLQYGADVKIMFEGQPDPEDVEGRYSGTFSPLHLAALFCSAATVNELVSRGAEIKATSIPDKRTVLHHALDWWYFRMESPGIVKTIIEHSSFTPAVMDALDSDEHSALQLALHCLVDAEFFLDAQSESSQCQLSEERYDKWKEEYPALIVNLVHHSSLETVRNALPLLLMARVSLLHIQNVRSDASTVEGLWRAKTALYSIQALLNLDSAEDRDKLGLEMVEEESRITVMASLLQLENSHSSDMQHAFYDNEWKSLHLECIRKLLGLGLGRELLKVKRCPFSQWRCKELSLSFYDIQNSLEEPNRWHSPEHPAHRHLHDIAALLDTEDAVSRK